MFMLLSKHASGLMRIHSLNMSVYAHIEVYKCLHTGGVARTHVHTQACMHAHMYTRTQAWLAKSDAASSAKGCAPALQTCVWTFIRHVRDISCAKGCAQAPQICKCMCWHVCLCFCVHKPAWVHACVYACVCAQVCPTSF